MVLWFEPEQRSIFDADVDALVCPVNCVGTMGAGLALEFSRKFKQSASHYHRVCKSKRMCTGKVLTTFAWDPKPEKPTLYIIYFATKWDWRNQSEMQWITSGLKDLRSEIESRKIASIAIPALGCGLGELQWPDVRQSIIDEFTSMESVQFHIYEPH